MTNAERQVEALLTEVDRLRDERATLFAEVERLRGENEELRQEIERLRKWAEDEEWLRHFHGTVIR